MEFSEFYNICKSVFAANPQLPRIDEDKANMLYFLTNRMLEVNKTMNLTAIKDENAIILRHYADSLMISEFLSPNSSIMDVGCGAGFPTLPLAIFRPDLKITALDSTSKRIEYVRNTAEMLNLRNVTAISERAEVLGNSSEYREKFDYATARAVAALPVLTELCMPFVKTGGQFIAMKAQKGDEELSASMNAISKCGGELKNSYVKELNDANGSAETRIIIVVSKIKHTPNEFPRHFSKISKKPL